MTAAKRGCGVLATRTRCIAVVELASTVQSDVHAAVLVFGVRAYLYKFALLRVR